MFFYEKYRKEQHGSLWIIFNREGTPLKVFKNVLDKTVLIFKNRVPKEGTRLITRNNDFCINNRADLQCRWLFH